MEEALERAAKRLEEVEARAADAETRAARAERLAELKAQEVGRKGELREVLDRIAAAERRASEAEERTRATVARIESGEEAVPPPPAGD